MLLQWVKNVELPSKLCQKLMSTAGIKLMLHIDIKKTIQPKCVFFSTKLFFHNLFFQWSFSRHMFYIILTPCVDVHIFAIWHQHNVKIWSIDVVPWYWPYVDVNLKFECPLGRGCWGWMWTLWPCMERERKGNGIIFKVENYMVAKWRPLRCLIIFVSPPAQLQTLILYLFLPSILALSTSNSSYLYLKLLLSLSTSNYHLLPLSTSNLINNRNSIVAEQDHLIVLCSNMMRPWGVRGEGWGGKIVRGKVAKGRKL